MTKGPPRAAATRSTDERGAVTLLAVACSCLLLLVGCALAVVGAMVVGHRTAQAAADLAALAGAAAARDGGDPCGSAAAIAADNGATLTRCAVDGTEVTVDVEVTGPRWLGQTGDLAARARAGPAGVTP
ncbi:Rv3654c family TadE-like protein [Nocardioides sp. TF02-7]|uniref:Rv3654c family TadE-like protein n=1 Tax=Nocardioides sp. TF02-7 TaxID=2917724 RepID=UPI001F056FBC|nr:Rv3654c family TadE-like protein [Nocardioides sp. TF02-7]UMG94013.1 flp pilus-assembly TadE/G-like family protein [Nocardioides sp. TF02-7]